MAYPSCVKTHELAYFAGFIDGEGTISVNSGGKQGGMRPIIAVVNTDRSALDFLNLHWGGNVYSRSGWGKNSKRAYWWRLVNWRAVNFVKDLLPYLNQKLPQAKLVLEWDKTRNPKVIQQIRKLNKRGLQ